MTDSEMLTLLFPPMPPGSGAAILRCFAASEGWRVDRIMGSGGAFVVEVTYLPLGWHGHVVCHPIGDDLFAVHKVGTAVRDLASHCPVPLGPGYRPTMETCVRGRQGCCHTPDMAP